MIERDVQVVSVTGQQVLVQFQRQSSCDSCSSNDSCGNGQLSKALSRRLDVLSFRCTEPVAAGDWVRVGISEQSLVRGTMVLYMLPLLCLIIAAMVVASFSQQYGASELWTLAAMVLGGYGGFRWAARLAPKVVSEPTLIKVLGRQAMAIATNAG
ncbi:SoxR reducing system RseC family protein [Gallaecimonas sp. GXIMD1310]|uniref:SoxR reducing system RseC family protein n=1 Tax=Gallaecimonas sp. GXIMD1310 TaxID=3131926 RepID=UPI003254217C